MRIRDAAPSLSLLPNAARSSEDGGGGTPDAGSGPDPLRADCEPLVPSVCGMSFPSYFLEDPETETGYRVSPGETPQPGPDRPRGAVAGFWDRFEVAGHDSAMEDRARARNVAGSWPAI